MCSGDNYIFNNGFNRYNIILIEPYIIRIHTTCNALVKGCISIIVFLPLKCPRIRRTVEELFRNHDIII